MKKTVCSVLIASLLIPSVSSVYAAGRSVPNSQILTEYGTALVQKSKNKGVSIEEVNDLTMRMAKGLDASPLLTGHLQALLIQDAPQVPGYHLLERIGGVPGGSFRTDQDFLKGIVEAFKVVSLQSDSLDHLRLLSALMVVFGGSHVIHGQNHIDLDVSEALEAIIVRSPSFQKIIKEWSLDELLAFVSDHKYTPAGSHINFGPWTGSEDDSSLAYLLVDQQITVLIYFYLYKKYENNTAEIFDALVRVSENGRTPNRQDIKGLVDTVLRMRHILRGSDWDQSDRAVLQIAENIWKRVIAPELPQDSKDPQVRMTGFMQGDNFMPAQVWSGVVGDAMALFSLVGPNFIPLQGNYSRMDPRRRHLLFELLATGLIDPLFEDTLRDHSTSNWDMRNLPKEDSALMKAALQVQGREKRCQILGLAPPYQGDVFPAQSTNPPRAELLKAGTSVFALAAVAAAAGPALKLFKSALNAYLEQEAAKKLKREQKKKGQKVVIEQSNPEVRTRVPVQVQEEVEVVKK